MKFFTYVIKSIKNGSEYVGMTESPERRLEEHNRGKVRTTKRNVPWEIIYLKGFTERMAAREHEKYLKTAAGRRFRKNIRGISSAG